MSTMSCRKYSNSWETCRKHTVCHDSLRQSLCRLEVAGWGLLWDVWRFHGSHCGTMHICTKLISFWLPLCCLRSLSPSSSPQPHKTLGVKRSHQTLPFQKHNCPKTVLPKPSTASRVEECTQSVQVPQKAVEHAEAVLVRSSEFLRYCDRSKNHRV